MKHKITQSLAIKLAASFTATAIFKDVNTMIEEICYNDDQGGYIWMDATDGTLVMHPILPDQEGTNRMDLEDCDGVKIIQKILEVADEGVTINLYLLSRTE